MSLKIGINYIVRGPASLIFQDWLQSLVVFGKEAVLHINELITSYGEKVWVWNVQGKVQMSRYSA